MTKEQDPPDKGAPASADWAAPVEDALAGAAAVVTTAIVAPELVPVAAGLAGVAGSAIVKFFRQGFRAAFQHRAAARSEAFEEELYRSLGVSPDEASSKATSPNGTSSGGVSLEETTRLLEDAQFQEVVYQNYRRAMDGKTSPCPVVTSTRRCAPELRHASR